MKTKVLLIGPDCFNYNQSVAAAFDTERFEVEIVDYAIQFGKICLTNKIRYFISRDRERATTRLLFELNQYILKKYNEYRPDIVLIIKGDAIDPGTVQQMQNSKNILWMMDGIYYNPQSIHLVDKMNAIFLFEKTDLTKVQKINPNSYYLPSAFDDKIFSDLNLKKTIDILFIGTLYQERVDLFKKLHQKFPKLNIKVYCERYRFYKNPIAYLKSFTDKVFVNRFVQPEEANILYNKSRVCINIHHQQSVYGINPRFFEIIGTNALIFTDHKPFLDDFFPNNEFNVYSTDEELIRMIDEHFNVEEKQNDLKHLKNIRDEHTYRNRVNYILGKI